MAETRQNPAPAPDDDVVDLRSLIHLLWSRNWTIVAITLTSAVISVIVALLIPNTYRAEALLAPDDPDRAGGLSALAAQYGGLASLAGINLGDRSVDRTDLALEILKSRQFLRIFIEHHEILVDLMAVDGWNPDTGMSEVDPDVYDVNTGKWVRKVSPPRTTVPSPQEAYEQFMGILTVSQDKATGFVSIAIEHYSPATAKQWIDWLVEDINSSIMERDVAEAEQAIEYLNEQISNTSLAGLQNVFFNLIEEQTKTVMLARMTDEYLLKTLDPAVVPEEKFRPRRALIVILSGMFGFCFAVIVVLISSYVSSPASREIEA
jgi:uncharacterized protein involved in exopolysaccharide biosynthesis